MIKIDWKNEQDDTYEEPLKIDFSKIIVPEECSQAPTALGEFKYSFDNGLIDNLSTGNVSFGSVAEAYKKTDPAIKTYGNSTVYNDENSNVTYLSTNPIFSAKVEPELNKTSGNVFANTISVSNTEHDVTTKGSITELQRIVQKLEKLEKMINPNSKKSLILWEEDNSFKNLISSIVTYANNCDTKDEFPIELYDKLKALGEDVDRQIIDGKAKIETLNKQATENVALSERLSKAYISATAGRSIEELESSIDVPELQEYKGHLEKIVTCETSSEEYIEAEKAIKSKISNLENSVHIAIDLERTTSKGSALEYIKKEVTPAIERLTTAYEEKNKSTVATTIDGEDAIMALTVKKSFAEKVYDTFVRPFANLFRRKKKVK